jgi:mannose-6-phosphate isomerase-like protein (cupin superfamily)
MDGTSSWLCSCFSRSSCSTRSSESHAWRNPWPSEFRAHKRVRKKLFEGAQLWGELLCYETGQATPSHHHPAEDELFVILEGHATVLAGDHQLDAPAGSLVIVPANVPHDLRNVGGGRLVVVFVKLSRAFGKGAIP